MVPLTLRSTATQTCWYVNDRWNRDPTRLVGIPLPKDSWDSVHKLSSKNSLERRLNQLGLISEETLPERSEGRRSIRGDDYPI
jgi:hypothetical protein